MKEWKDTTFKVGDLVRDKLNKGEHNYGLGVIVAIGTRRLGETPE